MKNTVFSVVAVSESFVNRICVIRKIVTSSTHETDYEEEKLQPTPAGHPQLATPLFLSPHNILKKEIRKKS
jgi:hypothetical protein